VGTDLTGRTSTHRLGWPWSRRRRSQRSWVGALSCLVDVGHPGPASV